MLCLPMKIFIVVFSCKAYGMHILLFKDCPPLSLSCRMAALGLTFIVFPNPNVSHLQGIALLCLILSSYKRLPLSDVRLLIQSRTLVWRSANLYNVKGFAQ